MRLRLLSLLCLILFLFSACQSAPEEPLPPESESVSESEPESVTEPEFSYDRLPGENSKAYLARIIEHERPQMLAEIAAEKENQGVIYVGEDRRKAERNYPLYNYHNSETSPYKPGRIFDASLSDEEIMSTYFYSHFMKDRLPFLQLMDYGPSVAYMADVYSYDMCLWGQVVMDDGMLRLKVIDCYWGDAEPGDLRPLPKINYHSADSHLVEGSEWFLMGSIDGNNSFQVDAYTVYRVENGRVKNLSYYDDFLQYDGWTPDELALQVGRILAKYCSES